MMLEQAVVLLVRVLNWEFFILHIAFKIRMQGIKIYRELYEPMKHNIYS